MKIVSFENHIRYNGISIHSIVDYYFDSFGLRRIESNNWDGKGREWTNIEEGIICRYHNDRGLTPEKLAKETGGKILRSQHIYDTDCSAGDCLYHELAVPAPKRICPRCGAKMEIIRYKANAG